jgi:Tol biopolymer transport system component
MTSPNNKPEPPKIKKYIILLGCLGIILVLGIALISLAILRWINQPQPAMTPTPQSQATRSAGFQATRAPTAGPTYVPTLATPAAVIHSSGPLLASSDFTWNTYTWYTGPVENDWWEGSWKIDQGIYRIDLKSKQEFSTWEYLQTHQVSDFEASVDFEPKQGIGSSSGGLVFRGSENNHYVFLIDSQGYYWFGRFYDGSWTTLIDWTTASTYLPNQANRLTVIAEGDHFQLLVNDSLVGEAVDGQSEAGSVGVVVEVYDTNLVVVHEFDNFELRLPASETGDALATPLIGLDTLAPYEAGAFYGKILLTSNRDGDYQIYALNPDGSGVETLTEASGDNYTPAWSPDGSQVAFVSNRDGNPEIYRMNADGSDILRLTQDPAEDSNPAWSPDGSKIAFVSWRDGNPELYVMDADGQNPARLTDSLTYDTSPTWSPLGDQIAFLSEDSEAVQIVLLTVETLEVKQLTESSSISWEGLSWSPAGDYLAYVERKDGNAEIYLLSLAGNQETRLTSNPFDDLYPAWSGDGQYLAFISLRDGNSELYISDITGGSYLRLTENSACDTSPSWQSRHE